MGGAAQINMRYMGPDEVALIGRWREKVMPGYPERSDGCRTGVILRFARKERPRNGLSQQEEMGPLGTSALGLAGHRVALIP